MEIRVIREPTGVLPELMPEVGAVYRATKSVRRPGVQKFQEFCWIELHGKKIVLRKGEYEIVAEDPPEEETMHKEQSEEETMHKEQEKTPVQEALPAPEPPPKKRAKAEGGDGPHVPGHAARHAAGGAGRAAGRADGGAGQEQPPGAGAAGPHAGALRKITQKPDAGRPAPGLALRARSGGHRAEARPPWGGIYLI